MSRKTAVFLLLLTAILATMTTAQTKTKPATNNKTYDYLLPKNKPQNEMTMRMRGTTMAQRKAAAAAAAKRRAATHTAPKPQSKMTSNVVGFAGAQALAAPAASVLAAPAVTLDEVYFGNHPNYANSPLPIITGVDALGNATSVAPGTGIRKFVNTLPGLNAANDLGQQIPVAVPDTTTFPGSDYYEIAVTQYQEKMHTDLPPTKLRGYCQLINGACAPGQPQYLGPLIVAQKDRPTRIKFVNMLPIGTGGDLFIPVDKTVMGAGLGPDGVSPYLENRATLHLHGGNTPWISDGTPHQWTVPAGDSSTTYPKGVSTQYVPDMFFDATGNVVPVPKCDAVTTTNCWPGQVPGRVEQ